MARFPAGPSAQVLARVTARVTAGLPAGRVLAGTPARVLASSWSGPDLCPDLALTGGGAARCRPTRGRSAAPGTAPVLSAPYTARGPPARPPRPGGGDRRTAVGYAPGRTRRYVPP
ncbi:hypothetical protein AMK26_12395 [Streptomyces sp. CB03234]|nr:hypothetical protein AMK26_12395 [Streptomyces sp. CB03234]